MKNNDLISKVREVRENKQKLNKLHAVCHCCSLVVNRTQMKLCDRCKNYICYECAARKFANSNIDLAEFEKTFFCPYCNETCRCKECQDKISKKEKEEKARRERARRNFYSIFSCLNCSLVGRDQKGMQIECDNCHEV